MKPLEDLEFVVLDVETTGLNPANGDRIVEIAALRAKTDTVLKEFQSLVNPGMPISEAASNVNHITDEMVKLAPGIDKVMPQFLDFIQGACIVGYNVKFDLSFIETELNRIKLKLPEDLMVMDVLNMARKILPNLERFSLACVSQSLKICEVQEHRALCDVQLTHKLFLHLLGLLKEKGVSDFKNVYNLFGMRCVLLSEINNQKVAQIQEALKLGVEIKIKYFSGTSQLTERNVTPKEIRQERDNTYLVGYCHLRKEERTFRVSSILHLEII